jgi:hypothetical protein
VEARAWGIEFGPIENLDRKPVGLGGEVEGVCRLELVGKTTLEFQFYFDETGEAHLVRCRAVRP